MSTNYYAKKEIAEDNRYDCPAKTIRVIEEIHIGKYSGGNGFILQDFWTAISDIKPTDKAMVVAEINSLIEQGYKIYDEYEERAETTMLALIYGGIYKNSSSDPELADGTPYMEGYFS